MWFLEITTPMWGRTPDQDARGPQVRVAGSGRGQADRVADRVVAADVAAQDLVAGHVEPGRWTWIVTPGDAVAVGMRIGHAAPARAARPRNTPDKCFTMLSMCTECVQ